MGSVNVSVRPQSLSLSRLRAASRAVTNFMRMSDATPPGPQTSACSTSLILASAAPSDLGRSLTYGAALRVARFGNANEHADWETAHHVFTYANALDQLIKWVGSDSDSDITVVRGVLHGAMGLYLTRYLNVPPARSACSTITGPWCGNATIVQQDRPYVPPRGL